jgi:glycerol kinase
MILAIDQGTTGTRSMVVDAAGEPVAYAYREHRQILPQRGWVEHDPEEIWSNVEWTARAALRRARIGARALAAIGIANQGETVMAWDARTGRPVHNAIVWQCSRTRAAMERLARDCAAARLIHRVTGLAPDCYFSASKMRWLYERVPECRRLEREGRLRMGTLDSWLVWKWSRGADFVTDSTTASRTLLMDLRTRQWSDAMLDLFRVRREWLAPIVDAMGPVATAQAGRSEVPILASAVDQQAALFGQCCFHPGEAKCTFGTGAFLLMHTGSTPVLSRRGLLATVAWSRRGRASYALEGGVYMAGAAVNWMRDVGLIADAAEAGALAESVADAGGVTALPCLAGLAAPHWSRRARGLLAGLHAGATRAHIVRAVLEGVAMQAAAVTGLMGKESGRLLRPPLRVDGGLSQNRFLMQFLADVLQLPVEAPLRHETTALGVAYMAGLEAGVFADREKVARLRRPGRTYAPSMSAAERAGHIARHRQAVRHAVQWGDR